jgi:hypothetical protein
VDGNIPLIGVSAHSGSALATAGFSTGQYETTVGHIHIEPGDSPMAIVTMSYRPMVWQLTGSTDRVRMFVPSYNDNSNDQGSLPVGVIGLPRDRVAFPKWQQCLPMHNEAEDKAATKIADLLGQTPTTILWAGRGGTISLPSKLIREKIDHPAIRTLPSVGPSADLWRHVQSVHGSGIFDVSIDKVVSARPLQQLGILPGEAGLAQLVDEEALEIMRSVSKVSIGNSVFITGEAPQLRRFNLPLKFNVRKPFTFPIGLDGVTKTFVLGNDAPMPDGDPGSTTRVVREHGSVVVGPSGSKQYIKP